MTTEELIRKIKMLETSMISCNRSRKRLIKKIQRLEEELQKIKTDLLTIKNS